MTENLASRWSRLKISRTDEAPTPTNDGAGLPDRTRAQDESGNLDRDQLSEQVFDVTSLPSIDSITVETDIRVFLQTGVPENLKRSALRRAWATNPAIRDFIGIAENQWDFNDPDAIPGFGPLRDADNIPMLRCAGHRPIRECLRLNRQGHCIKRRFGCTGRDVCVSLGQAAHCTFRCEKFVYPGITAQSNPGSRVV
jgi:Protein of unknown function (DUF3306)